MSRDALRQFNIVKMEAEKAYYNRIILESIQGIYNKVVNVAKTTVNTSYTDIIRNTDYSAEPDLNLMVKGLRELFPGCLVVAKGNQITVDWS